MRHFKLPVMGFKTRQNEIRGVCYILYFKWVKFNYEAFQIPLPMKFQVFKCYIWILSLFRIFTVF